MALLTDKAGKPRTQTPYEYGVRAEQNVRNTLKAQNYHVIRAAASQGIFDIVAFHAEGKECLCVQVKRGEKPSPCDYKTATALPVPPGIIKMVVWYPHGMSAARVLYCADHTGEIPLPEWCASARWLAGPLPKQPALRGL